VAKNPADGTPGSVVIWEIKRDLDKWLSRNAARARSQRIGGSGGDLGEQVADDEGRPQDGFDDGPDMGPESRGVLPVVDNGPDEPQTVDCVSTTPHNDPFPRRS